MVLKILVLIYGFAVDVIVSARFLGGLFTFFKALFVYNRNAPVRKKLRKNKFDFCRSF